MRRIRWGHAEFIAKFLYRRRNFFCIDFVFNKFRKSLCLFVSAGFISPPKNKFLFYKSKKIFSIKKRPMKIFSVLIFPSIFHIFHNAPPLIAIINSLSKKFVSEIPHICLLLNCFILYVKIFPKLIWIYKNIFTNCE